MNKIIYGCCIEESQKIETGTVDLILTDPPYGNIKGMTLGSWDKNTNAWDIAIEPLTIFDIANRILRKNGKLILFSQEPYTTRLINEAIPNVPFSYRMIWKKETFANALGVNKAPVNHYEDILVFSKNNPVYDSELGHPLRPYFKQVFEFIGQTKKVIFSKVGTGADHVFRFNSSQFSLCTEETYNKIIAAFGISNMPEFLTFEELKAIDGPHKAQHNETVNMINPSIFNLWEGGKHKSNIFKYKKDYPSFHPTQKPVALLEDLIKTYSREGDMVVDLTAGSGSTAVAAQNSNRKYIVIEKDHGHYNTILKRTGADFAEELIF